MLGISRTYADLQTAMIQDGGWDGSDFEPCETEAAFQKEEEKFA